MCGGGGGGGAGGEEEEVEGWQKASEGRVRG